MASAYRIVWSNPWVRAGVGLAAFVGVALLLYFMRPILVPLFFAFIIAYIFDPLVDIFERRRIPRMATIMVLVLGMFMAMAAVPLVLVPNIIQQADELIRASGDLDKEPWVVRIEQRLPLDRLVEALGWAEIQAENEASPIEVLVSQGAQVIRDNAGNFLRAHANEIVGAGTTASRSFAEFVRSSGDFILRTFLFFGNLALFLFVAIYLLKDYDRIIVTIGELVPPRFRDKTSTIMTRIDNQLKAFLRGQLMVMFALGLMYAIGFKLSGVLFAVPLAIFGGAASFVPYLGAALTIGPAVILTLVVHGIDWHLAAVLATFGIAQSIESYILTPKVVGSKVGLGPVWVILAVLVFSSWLGFLGLLLAVPIAAALKVFVTEGVDLYRNSQFYQGYSPSPSLSPAVAEGPAESPAPARSKSPRKPSSAKAKSSSASKAAPRRKKEK